MAKTKKSKPAATEKKPAVGDPEAEAEALLKSYDDGDVDNAWDVIDQLFELDKRLSKTSPLRKRFDQMYEDIETICRENP